MLKTLGRLHHRVGPTLPKRSPSGDMPVLTLGELESGCLNCVAICRWQPFIIAHLTIGPLDLAPRHHALTRKFRWKECGRVVFRPVENHGSLGPFEVQAEEQQMICAGFRVAECRASSGACCFDLHGRLTVGRIAVDALERLRFDQSYSKHLGRDRLTDVTNKVAIQRKLEIDLAPLGPQHRSVMITHAVPGGEEVNDSWGKVEISHNVSRFSGAKGLRMR